METTILIADDHSIIRKGLKLLTQLTLGYSHVHEVDSCSKLMNELLKKTYTHLILDIILSDGSSLEILPNIRRLYPKLHIMIFSMQPAEVYGAAVKKYGIEHYLSKTAGDEEMQQFLTRFLQNDAPAPRALPNRENPFTALAPRELEILHYLLRGVGTKEISEVFNLRMSTVSTLKNRIFEKTQARNIKELIELATLYNVNY